MKHFFLFLSLVAFMELQAKVRTVSNHPTTIAQFSTIQAAVDSSANGDTVYVHGSPTEYPAFTISNKRLVILGPGWAPDKNYFPFKASVNQVTIEGQLSKHTEIQGLLILSYVNVIINLPDSLRFIRNQFKSSININTNVQTYRGYVFQDNYFDGGYIVATPHSNYVNFLFQNNLFYEAYSGTGNVYGLSNCTNVLFDHNLWYGPAATSTIPCFSGDSKFVLLTNNIFVRRNPASGLSYSTFNNNITFNAGVSNPWTMNGNTSAGGNVDNQDPQMGDQTAVNSGTNNPLLNFTITAGPADNAGSDGKDIGLLFDNAGILNWSNSRMSRLPMIFSMSIANPTLPPGGGTLNVQVQARRIN